MKTAKNSDKELINRAFYGERAIAVARVFRAIKKASYISTEELANKLRVEESEVIDLTDSLRRAGFIVSNQEHHQTSRSYKEGQL